MSDRTARIGELLGALIVAIGAALVYLPAGLIVFGLLLIVAMQGVRPRDRQR